MQKVDLTLAVNYLPACTCLGKMLVFMLAVGFIPSNGENCNAYVILAAILYMDRMVTRNIIFDANAILMAVFFANIHAAIRAHGTMRTYPILMAGLHICWVNTCALLIAEPVKLREVLQGRLSMNKLVPVFMLLVIIVSTSYFHEDFEPPPMRACRAVVFTLLTFAWIYVVGVHSQNGLEYLKENSCQFVARLAPVLYSPAWIAFLFCPAVVWGLVIQNMRQNASCMPDETLRSAPQSYQLLSSSSRPPASMTTMSELPVAGLSMTTPSAVGGGGGTGDVPVFVADLQQGGNGGSSSSQDSDLEHLFRLAKQAHRARPTLDTISEVA
jgi:hypothetical protein